MKKVTDNDIIKDFECCKSRKCSECSRLHNVLSEKCECRLDLMEKVYNLINRLNERNKKNERIIELDEKLIKTQSAEIDFLRASKNLHEAEFNEAKVELELKKAEIEKVREANRFYERSRLNCQILTLEAFAKNLKNVFVNIDGIFEFQEIEDRIDDFLNRTVNEAKKDYRAICQDDKSSYDLINKTKSEAIKEFAERLNARICKDIDEQGMFPLPYTKKAYDTVRVFIDNIVKEMEGEQ